MAWHFERVAGPYEGGVGGVAWDGTAVIFAAVGEARLLSFDPATKAATEIRRYTNRTNGIAFGPERRLYGCQEGSRRVIQFLADGSATVTATKLAGRHHNFPSDLTVARSGAIWFADPYNPMPAFGPQLFAPLDHASVLCLQRNGAHQWVLERKSFDTAAPRAVLLSPDEKTLYVAEGDAGAATRELRAYPVGEDGRLGAFTVLHTFGRDHRGPHRGIEGMCLDADGNIVACAGWRRSGPGPMLYVFSPSGAVLETHPLPDDLPQRCQFGGAGLDSLYLTTAGGHLLCAERTTRRGYDRFT
ncbi:MAG TPA: SMP-30/gluconolactonase/LRE family protein [Caulobacteraceae bacterium]|jgi:gluconolactonase|nr:SMP-30/gluconolactonase/LRE family protein [Caulobacteraceae bacterium]